MLGSLGAPVTNSGSVTTRGTASHIFKGAKHHIIEVNVTSLDLDLKAFTSHLPEVYLLKRK
jgi:hypothetical protein